VGERVGDAGRMRGCGEQHDAAVRGQGAGAAVCVELRRGSGGRGPLQHFESGTCLAEYVCE
jgi:hypothetical protein